MPSKMPDPIEQLKYIGLITGDENGDLRLDRTMTRAEACAVLSKTMGNNDSYVPNETDFTDVPSDHWAAPCIYYLKNKGYVRGMSESEFEPEGVIAFHQFIFLVSRIVDPNHRSEQWVAESINLISRPFVEAHDVTRQEAFELISKALSTEYAAPANAGFLPKPYAMIVDFITNNVRSSPIDFLWNKRYKRYYLVRGLTYDKDEKKIRATCYEEYDDGQETRPEESIVFNNELMHIVYEKEFIAELSYDYEFYMSQPSVVIWADDSEPVPKMVFIYDYVGRLFVMNEESGPLNLWRYE